MAVQDSANGTLARSNTFSLLYTHTTHALHCECYRGINRSVTTAAVFMAKCGVGSFDACVEAIKGARPQAGPLPQYQAWGRKFCEAGFQTPAP